LNDELSRAKDAADDANLSKTKFLAAASHDILQPLNAARLYASSVIERDQKQGAPELAQSLATSLEAVEDILMTLLDISRLDAGAMKAEMTNFRLADVFAGIKTDLEPMAREKRITLVFVPTSLAVRSDRRLLRRLIQNLVSNAIKYTPSGRVLVGVRRQKNKVRLEVWDTGIGIPLSQQKLVFDEFQRLDDGVKLARGLGLGLSIVERIARLLRHPVKLQSETGKGSMFSVEMPMSQAVLEARVVPDQPSLSAPLAGMMILAIDNEPTILDAMERLLKNWGCDVRVAADLQDARNKAAEFTNGPDVIIADYHLDDGATGLEAVSALREDYQRDIPAILVTADRSQMVRDEAVVVDATVLHKPLKPAAMRALLAQWRAKLIRSAPE
jgi:CheY-like chemotaxis protein/two-component sensor histidine kinase